jgi:hypothetical protein
METEFHEWDKNRILSLPVPKYVFKKYLNEELALSNGFKSLIRFSSENYKDTSKYPDNITFNLKSTYAIADKRGKTHYGLRTQDLLLLDIIKTNNWQRPVYFAMTFGSDMRIGLDNYLRHEGMALCLTPFPLNTRNEFMNAKILWDQFTKEKEGFSREPEYGYKFRNLNSPGLYLDENAMKIAKNYRHIFLNFAAYFINFTRDTAKAAEILGVMENKISSSTVSMDYKLKYDMVSFFRVINREDKVRILSSEIEKDCLRGIQKDPMNVKDPLNPYRVLIDVYELLSEYDKEIDILKKLTMLFPQDNGLKNKIEQVRLLKNPPQNLPVIDSTNNKTER